MKTIEHLLKLHDLTSSVAIFFLEFVCCFVALLNMWEALVLFPFQTAQTCCSATFLALSAQRSRKPMYSYTVIAVWSYIRNNIVPAQCLMIFERRRKSFFLWCLYFQYLLDNIVEVLFVHLRAEDTIPFL